MCSLCGLLFNAKKATLQNVKNTKRLLVNPDVPEVVAFRDRYEARFLLFFLCCGLNFDTHICKCNCCILIVD